MHTIPDVLPRRLRQADDHERGATAVEYALMTSLIAVVIIGVVAFIGTTVMEMFDAANANWPNLP